MPLAIESILEYIQVHFQTRTLGLIIKLIKVHSQFNLILLKNTICWGVKNASKTEGGKGKASEEK